MTSVFVSGVKIREGKVTRRFRRKILQIRVTGHHFVTQLVLKKWARLALKSKVTDPFKPSTLLNLRANLDNPPSAQLSTYH